MQDLNTHPCRHLNPPTEAQLDALSARKQQLVQRDRYVCPLCEQIPQKIQPLVERGNPAELFQLLTEHIANHIKSLSLISLPCLDSEPVDTEGVSTKFENSFQRLLNPGSIPQLPSGIEYVDNDSLSLHSLSISPDDVPTATETSEPQLVRLSQTGKSYDLEYSDYEPPKPPPYQENFDWVHDWLTWKEESDGLHKQPNDTDPVIRHLWKLQSRIASSSLPQAPSESQSSHHLIAEGNESRPMTEETASATETAGSSPPPTKTIATVAEPPVPSPPAAYIAVMGSTGVGKTSFINQVTGSSLTVGRDLSRRM